jgi:hypothetical protein
MSLHCRSIIQHNLLSNAVYGSSSHRDIAIKSTMLLLTVAQSLILRIHVPLGTPIMRIETCMINIPGS